MCHAVGAIGTYTSRYLHVFNVYGHSGARAHIALRNQNEDILNHVAAALTFLKDQPVVICMDLNQDLEQSETLSHLIAHGVLVDAAAVQAHRDGNGPNPTFCTQSGWHDPRT